MKALMLVLSLLLVTGCSEHYRYPCQDPDNWKKEECQKPRCEADGTCPEQLTGIKIDLEVEAVEENNVETSDDTNNEESTGE
jgi:hypothetical protein